MGDRRIHVETPVPNLARINGPCTRVEYVAEWVEVDEAMDIDPSLWGEHTAGLWDKYAAGWPDDEEATP